MSEKHIAETTKWQSIETAPKDKWVIVFDPDGVADTLGLADWQTDEKPRVYVFMAHWNEKEWIACFGEVDGWGCPSGGYDHWVAGLIVSPTHWMPRPAPPDGIIIPQRAAPAR